MEASNSKEQFKLDVKDKKILFELDKNCRQSCSEIGKKVGLSSEVVNYRIKRLEESGIITFYQTVVNLSTLGIIQFKVVLTLQGIDSLKLDAILKKLGKMKEVVWIALSKGNWDLIVSCEAKSLQEINEVKEKLLSSFFGFVREKAVAICYKSEVLNRDYLLNTNSINRKRVINDNEKEIKLTQTELGVIDELSKNARNSIINIASNLKETERITNYTIKQLEKKGVIVGYRIAIDYNKAGIKYYKTFVYLENKSKERVDELISYFNSNKNIIHNVQVLGNWDFEPEFECYSEQEFDVLLNALKDKFSDVIKRMDVLTISKEYKANYL